MLITSVENRGFKRMPINIPVIIIENERELSGKCIDLSATGMKISFADTALKVGDIIFVKLETKNKRFPSLNVNAKIIRINPENELFFAAITFTEFVD